MVPFQKMKWWKFPTTLSKNLLSLPVSGLRTRTFLLLEATTIAVLEQHLYNLGHRKITHISGPDSNILTKVRRWFYECKKLKLDLTNENIIRGDFSIQAGYAAASQILSFSEKPTAITCASDEIAIGVISQLRKAGISVPNDISVVGFDDIEISNTYIPTLTTVVRTGAISCSINGKKPKL